MNTQIMEQFMDRRRQTLGGQPGTLIRISAGGNAICVWIISMTEPRSLSWLVSGNYKGWLLTTILMVLGIAVILDTIINDILPDQFHWKIAERQRHFILLGMAFCHVSQLSVAYYHLQSPGLLLYYAWNAVILVGVALIDAYQRTKDLKCSILAQ